METYAIVVPTNGDMRKIRMEVDSLAMFYREIGCRYVDCVGLDNPDGSGGLDMWIDDEGQMVEYPTINTRATGVVLAARGQVHQLYFGTAVFTGGANHDGESLGLSAEAAKAIMSLATRQGKQIDAYLGARSLSRGVEQQRHGNREQVEQG